MSHYRSHVCHRCGREDFLEDIIVTPYECPPCRIVAEEERLGLHRQRSGVVGNQP